MHKTEDLIVADCEQLEAGELSELLGYQLRLTQQAILRDFDRQIRAYGVSPGRFNVLSLIEANPGIIQSRLAQAVQLERSTMVAILDQLEERKLVERRPSANDRRSNELWLTAQGVELLQKMRKRVTSHQRKVLAPLSRHERGALLTLLKRIRTHLATDECA